MKLGKCPMCDTDKQIVKSHLFPRASYKYFREQGFELLFLSQEVMHPTNKQIWAHLLCRECEDVLNSGGETWLVPQLARYSGDFPLYDLVVRGRPVDDQEDPKVYATEGVAGLDSEKLVHVALGIFWKCSVHHWLGKLSEPFIELGKHGNLIRRFLQGKGVLAQDLALCVTVCHPPVTAVCFTLPRFLQRDGFEQFFFYFGGLKFDLLLGDGLREIKQLCLHANPRRLICVENLNPEMQMVSKRHPWITPDAYRYFGLTHYKVNKLHAFP